MKFQVLLSAMNLKDESYLDTLNIKSDAVVVNQCERTSRKEIDKKADGITTKVTFIESTERGLSKSRNMAIRNAKADICIFCDNDVEYVEGYEELILKEFDAYPSADVIVFYIKRKEKPEPNYLTRRWMGYLSVLKIFSPEIAFRRKSISGISFNEDFGAGSGKFLMGEENIFLYDCLKQRKKILYVPIQIASLREEESTWFKGYDEKFFISRGAGYTAMSKPMSSFLIWQFALRKRNLYRKDMTVMQAVIFMYRGRKQYLSGR